MTERRTQRARPGAQRREGAAMLVVMLVLLMATATAIFSVHATSYEVRAAGHGRRAMQTQYVSEGAANAGLAWLDQASPVGLKENMTRVSRQHMAAGDPVLSLEEFHEPNIPDNGEGLRLMRQHLESIDATSTVKPISRETLGGNQQVYDAVVYVDVYDRVKWTADMAGERSESDQSAPPLRVTMTARGRTRVAEEVGSDKAWDDPPGGRPYHEGASDARVHALVTRN